MIPKSIKWYVKEKRLLGVIVLSLLGAGLMGCESSRCTLSWQPNKEPDLKEYRLILWPSDRPHNQKNVKVSAPKTQLTCEEAGITEPGEWYAKIQTCDYSDNCSAFTKPVKGIVKK